jgi:hypothetical protein
MHGIHAWERSFSSIPPALCAQVKKLIIMGENGEDESTNQRNERNRERSVAFDAMLETANAEEVR